MVSAIYLWICLGPIRLLESDEELYNRAMTIPFEDIQAMAGQIAEQFNPSKIYLFGSYAHGHHTDESDLDFLVVMNAPDSSKPTFYSSFDIRRALSLRFLVNIIGQSGKAQWLKTIPIIISQV